MAKQTTGLILLAGLGLAAAAVVVLSKKATPEPKFKVGDSVQETVGNLIGVVKSRTFDTTLMQWLYLVKFELDTITLQENELRPYSGSGGTNNGKVTVTSSFELK